MASNDIPEFMENWNGCFAKVISVTFDRIPLLSEEIGSLLSNELAEALQDALGKVDPLIAKLLKVELQFLCDYDGGTGSSYPNTDYARLEKLKIFLKSLIALLDTLDAKSKKLLHILIEFICLAQ